MPSFALPTTLGSSIAAGSVLVLGGVSSIAVVMEIHSDYQERKHIAASAAADGAENTTGHGPYSLPRYYDRQAVRDYWSKRPVSVVSRIGSIAFELTPIVGVYAYDRLWLRRNNTDKNDTTTAAAAAASIARDHHIERETQQAVNLREALTNLGPAFVKAGQQLAIRPDLVSPTVLKELQQLCDSVRPIPDEMAMQVMSEELMLVANVDNPDAVFEDLHLVASASLGQVYKGRLRESGELVAIKVQRPGMRKAFSLDLFLLQLWGDFMDAFTSVFTKQIPFHAALFDSFSHGSYSELDYENEAKNQLHFQEQLAARRCNVKVPDVFLDYSTQRILTTEWIEGKKLADAPKETIRTLIPVGVELFLTQLLDIGAFHSDPHPGNLLVTEDGTLCLLDFGLCAEVDAKSREAMTKAIVHLLCRDFDSLIHQDTKELGFLPQDFDTEELKPILTKVLTGAVLESGSDLKKRKRKFMEISNELNDIFFRYPFQVPGFFALVTRGLGLLEGIALVGDPDFDIFKASAPYATKRAVALLGKHWTRGVTTTPSSHSESSAKNVVVDV